MTEAFLHGAAFGLVIGAAMGLVPLSIGLYRKKPQGAVLVFFGSVGIGALFGFYGALPFSLFTSAALWRGQPIRGVRE